MLPRSFRRTAVVWGSMGCAVALIAACAASGEADADFESIEAPSADASREATPGEPSWPDGGDPSGDDAAATDPDAGDAPDAGDLPDAGPIDAGPADAGPADAGVIDAGGGDTGTAKKPTQGEVVISEIMFNPSGTEPEEEWFELYNTASGPRILSGLVLKDGGNRTHTIGAGVVIAPGAYAVFVSDEAAAVGAKIPPGVIVYDYNTGASSTVQLSNNADGALVLLSGSTEIARARYGSLGFGKVKDASIQLKTLTFAASATNSNWCESATAWAPGADLGTPGAPSDCP